MLDLPFSRIPSAAKRKPVVAAPLASDRRAGSVALEEAEIPFIPTLGEHFRDGRVLTLSQSNAILMYAAEGIPPRLLPPDAAERALVLQRFFYFVTDVIAVSHAGFATNDNGGDPSFLDARSLGALALAESFLENSTFMAGEAFSLSNPKTLGECG